MLLCLKLPRLVRIKMIKNHIIASKLSSQTPWRENFQLFHFGTHGNLFTCIVNVVVVVVVLTMNSDFVPLNGDTGNNIFVFIWFITLLSQSSALGYIYVVQLLR